MYLILKTLAASQVILAGSADWMPRNFFRRVEVLFPILDPALRRWVTAELFQSELRDNVNAFLLHSNGAYAPPPLREDEPAVGAGVLRCRCGASRRPSN